MGYRTIYSLCFDILFYFVLICGNKYVCVKTKDNTNKRVIKSVN